MIVGGKVYDAVFNKKYGQNFIFDKNLLAAIARDADTCRDDTVVEIGAGAGTLTAALAEVAGEVIAYEIDENLKPVLDDTLAGYTNVRVVYEDFMKKTAPLPEKFKVVANLPYYITTPIIMHLLENEVPQSICVMVQKEVAERLVAPPGDENYGAITAVLGLVADARITRIVGRQNFVPQPNVDSAVVLITVRDKGYTKSEIAEAKRLIHAAFAMRRKTLANNLAAVCGNKEAAITLITSCGFNPAVRGEQLSCEDYVRLARGLSAR